MADEADGEVVDYVEQGGEVQNVFANGVGCAVGPGAVAVAAEVECVDVVVVAERLRYPVPVAGVVQGAVDQNDRGLVILAVVPELELQAVGVEEVRDGFQCDRAPWQT